MKQTGVVRKIDELGRIVLPKEIRRNLGIKDGESLEIFVDEKGIYLQKFSKIYDLKELGNNICQDIKDIMNINLIITDRDKIVSAFNEQLIGDKITNELENLMVNREYYQSKFVEKKLEKLKEGYFIIKPIIVSTDCMGMVIMYKDIEFLDWEKKFVDFICQFFIKTIEI